MKNIMKKIKIMTMVIAVGLCFAACDDMFEPAIENQGDLETRLKEPSYAQGLIGSAYASLPYSYQGAPTSDLATDDAVHNDPADNYARMATGSWAANNDPLSQWTDRYAAIQYTNLMLESADKVKWADSLALRTMFADHFKGEAYGMRALQMFYLLRAHAGLVGGELMGVPIHEASEDGASNFNVERPSYSDCVAFMLADLDKAMELLPFEDGNITAEKMPEKYKKIGGVVDQYNRAFGDHMIGRINGKICEALKSQILLYAASPAYAKSGYTWEQAAQAAAAVLKRIGGINGLDPNGHTYYCNKDELKNLTAVKDPKEIIWRGDVQNINTLESDNYPPSLLGNGRVNPTQNFVDAFPMQNGYPINYADKKKSGYDATNPYVGRDPRLALYVVLNESTQGSEGKTIVTGVYGDNADALNRENKKSTRTGYYLRKLLRDDINLNTGTNQNHYVARIRYTEIFLNYAEACNEAYGPTGEQGGCGSAYQVIKKIRERAGICANTNDPYLKDIADANDKAKMRELIRNERRIELCFEGHRFYDLRRWSTTENILPELTATAGGMEISKDASSGALIYKKIEVDPRAYTGTSIYGPIPYSEIMKFGNLKQNDGWR